MKFRCHCGYLFADNTDFLRFKGHITADQDLEELDYSVEHYHISERDYIKVLCNMRTIYQCPHCGMIYIDNDDGNFSVFVPAQYVDMNRVSEKVREIPKKQYDKNCRLLQSAQGDKWRGWICVEWYDEKRDWEEAPLRRIFVELNSHEYDEYKKRQYDSLDEMKADYIKLVRELSQKNLIKYARFSVNGKAVAELGRNYSQM